MRDNELILLNDNHQHQGNKYEISMLSLGAKDFRFFAYQHLIVALAFFGYREKEAHIVGAIIVQQAFGIGILLLGVWERERNLKSAHEEISLALGIAIGDLDNAEHQHKLIQFVAARYSSELLRNRLSDLCRWIQMGWTWLGVIVQYGILLV